MITRILRRMRTCLTEDMLLEDCTFTADVVLLGWAMHLGPRCKTIQRQKLGPEKESAL